MARPFDDEDGQAPQPPPKTAEIIDLPRERYRRPGFVASDKNLADCVVDVVGEVFAYSTVRKAWRWFDATRWTDNAVVRLHAAITARLTEIGPHIAKKPKEKLHIGKRSTVTAVEGSMRERCVVDEDMFDANPWLLNCPSGTVDLKFAGAPLTLRKHDLADYCTKMTAVDPLGDCPLWLEHIDFIACGDAELMAYLQRLCGYALLGIAPEQMLAFLYGTGANGKSVFLQTLLHVLGDYAVTAQMDTFTTSKFPRHSEELMVLRGARLIVASETGGDQTWNEARIKMITGGERIRARYMKENSVEFELCGTLIIAGNDKPALDNVDEAMRRRMHIVPFLARVSDDMRDNALAEKLKAEGGGILKWCLRGCEMYQVDGLAVPGIVAEATSEYLSGEDQVRQWVDVEVIASPDGRVSNTDLFASWRKYAEAEGIEPHSSNWLSKRLAKMKDADGQPRFVRFHSKTGRGFRSIALRADLERAKGDSTFWDRR